MSASKAGEREGIVLLVDVVGSSAVPDFGALRDRKIARLTRLHRKSGSIAADYTVTAWDEFQNVLLKAEQLPQVLFDIRRILAPWEVYIGAGTGGVTGWRSRKPINRALSGEAFERARRAIEELKAGKGEKYRRLTRFVSADAERDRLLNLIYGLHDTLVQQVTERQWETLNAVLEQNATQEEVAVKLEVQPSTVTRNLKRAHYWQMQETIKIVSALLTPARERAIR